MIRPFLGEPATKSRINSDESRIQLSDPAEAQMTHDNG